MITSLKTIHRESDGISPYLRCPWCSYSDVIGEFLPYRHGDEPIKADTLSTECGQCEAAGHTAYFLLAYDPAAPLYDHEHYRQIFLELLRNFQNNA